MEIKPKKQKKNVQVKPNRCTLINLVVLSIVFTNKSYSSFLFTFDFTIAACYMQNAMRSMHTCAKNQLLILNYHHFPWSTAQENLRIIDTRSGFKNDDFVNHHLQFYLIVGITMQR